MSEHSKARYAALTVENRLDDVGLALDELLKYLEWLPERDHVLEYTAGSVKTEVQHLRDRIDTVYQAL